MDTTWGHPAERGSQGGAEVEVGQQHRISMFKLPGVTGTSARSSFWVENVLGTGYRIGTVKSPSQTYERHNIKTNPA